MTNTANHLRGILPAVCLFVAMANPALAGIAVSPLKQEVSVKPGEVGKVRITLSNNVRKEIAAAQGAHLSIADVGVSEDGTLEFKNTGVLETSASKWITLNKTDVMMEPGQTEAIECTIAPPLTAPPGEYYNAVIVAMATKGLTEKGVVVNYRVASGVFLTVLGRTLPKQAKITRCEVVWPAADTAGATTRPAPTTRPTSNELPRLAVVLQNTGQSRFDASGKMTLLDAKSRMVFVSPLTSGRPCVFGGDSRRFDAFFTKPLPAGKYRIRVELDYQSSWAKARHEIPVEILPAEAELLLSLKRQMQQEAPVAEVLPERLTAMVPPGANRSLALTVRNTSEAEIQCSASVTSFDVAQAESWITMRPQEFSVSRSSRKSVELRVDVPRDAKPGRYFSTVTIEGGMDGLKLRKIEVPVEIEVNTEK